MIKVYLSEIDWENMMNFSMERNWDEDVEVEIEESELGGIKVALEVLDEKQDFLRNKYLEKKCA